MHTLLTTNTNTGKRRFAALSAHIVAAATQLINPFRFPAQSFARSGESDRWPLKNVGNHLKELPMPHDSSKANSSTGSRLRNTADLGNLASHRRAGDEAETTPRKSARVCQPLAAFRRLLSLLSMNRSSCQKMPDFEPTQPICHDTTDNSLVVQAARHDNAKAARSVVAPAWLSDLEIAELQMTDEEHRAIFAATKLRPSVRRAA